MAQKCLNYDGLVIGYYCIRGKAQVCRHLCEYLHVPYKEIIFTPQTWEQFKQTQGANWTYQQIPFLKHKDVIVTETFPICLYIINQTGHKELLGATLQDEAEVDMFVWQTEIMAQILGLMANLKNETHEKKKQVFCKFWQQHLRERFIKYEKLVTNTYFLSYLTIVDFYIYNAFYFLKIVCPDKLAQFPKLMQIHNRVSQIPEISSYENSSKAIKEICPSTFCQKWKQKCKELKEAFRCGQ